MRGACTNTHVQKMRQDQEKREQTTTHSTQDFVASINTLIVHIHYEDIPLHITEAIVDNIG